MNQADRWSTHTYQVLVESHGMAEGIFDIDSGIQAYALTDQARFLRPLNVG